MIVHVFEHSCVGGESYHELCMVLVGLVSKLDEEELLFASAL